MEINFLQPLFFGPFDVEAVSPGKDNGLKAICPRAYVALSLCVKLH